MFTSFEEQSGKTSVLANLALLLVQSNKNVLMVDCDLKRGSLTNMFNVSKKNSGLLNALSENKKLPSIYNLLHDKNKETDKSLHIIPPGGIKDNSSDLLETEMFPELLERIKNLPYDYILIDTPPVTRVIDGLITAKYVKNSLLIVRPDYTLKDGFKWGLEELKQTNTTIHGIVVNACDIENSSFKYSYRYGYSYSYEFSDNNRNNNNGKKGKLSTAFNK
jgi:capsular exopolysaccharide synthesis family protein